MEYLLDGSAIVEHPSDSPNLYDWSLKELTPDGEKAGQPLIPWLWSAFFVAVDVQLVKSTEVKQQLENEILRTHLTDNRRLVLTLRPGALREETRDRPSYSFVSTSREITNIVLTIVENRLEDELERCYAWGSVAYRQESDLGIEETNDTLTFFLHVGRMRFDTYVESINSGLSSTIMFTVSSVSGFYAEWSPSITTDLIKVLAVAEDQAVDVPMGCDICLPVLGAIGRCSLSLSAKQRVSAPPISIVV